MKVAQMGNKSSLLTKKERKKMNTIETIEKVDKTLTNLEASFKAFQDSQEKRIQHI